ncbi:MAG: hypothetical protein HYV97_05135 [Bdellovibrio sp.]|nr:hypothetical protein [Bdellovibrio sp.]
MPRPKFRVVGHDEVKISRDGVSAIFTYADETMGGGMNLKIGPEVASLNDDELLEHHNNVVRSIQETRDRYEHIAVEIPLGKPQIEFDKQCGQWSMRGDVLRASISDLRHPETDVSEPIIEVDGKELSWQEFGRMLTTFSGWGMRLTIVPDDELHIMPNVRIMNSREDKIEI